MPVPLTPRERTHLKGRAHALEPIVQVGVGGLSDAVVVELERALTAHGLIKVKINGPDREVRRALAEEICVRTDAAPVHRVGKIIVLWRPTPEEQSVTLPARTSPEDDEAGQP
jgi:putative YhbY family RNA-binding protein